MTEEVAWRAGRRVALGEGRAVGDGSGSRTSRDTDASTDEPALETYDEGLERYFELSSRLARLRVEGGGTGAARAALRAEADDLQRELSTLSRELPLEAVGSLLEEPPDGPR